MTDDQPRIRSMTRVIEKKWQPSMRSSKMVSDRRWSAKDEAREKTMEETEEVIPFLSFHNYKFMVS